MTPMDIIIILLLVNITFVAALFSITIYNVYSIEANQQATSALGRITIINKLNSITNSLADVLTNLTQVTTHLVNNTHAINATLHNIQGNQSALKNATATLANETGFYPLARHHQQ
jgi:hypothetical protein